MEVAGSAARSKEEATKLPKASQEDGFLDRDLPKKLDHKVRNLPL